LYYYIFKLFLLRLFLSYIYLIS